MEKNLLEKTLYSREEIIEILKNTGDNEQLFALADKVRHEKTGDEVHLRGLIEFSNICKRQCKYCGLRAPNKKVSRYRMMPEEIILCAQNAAEAGYKTIVLQSGEDDYYSRDILCRIISGIKKFDTAVTLSIGERSFEDYKAFKDCGADRYLLRIETTDKDLYKKMHPGMDINTRIRCLEHLRELDYEVGTGCLVGLPDQTPESLADDILFFKEINADMVGIGPLIPHPETPLKECPLGSLTTALKVMAITRIILENINIPATTAMETLDPEGRILALKSGANVIMPNVTPTIYKNKYEIYPNKAGYSENALKSRKYAEEILKKAGRSISKGYGFRKK